MIQGMILLAIGVAIGISISISFVGLIIWALIQDSDFDKKIDE